MPEIIEFIRRERTFDPQSTGVPVKAYERAADAVQGIDQSRTLREIIARRIVAAAMRGETNPERLCEAALAALARTEPSPAS
jgi:hypothetical protein